MGGREREERAKVSFRHPILEATFALTYNRLVGGHYGGRATLAADLTVRRVGAIGVRGGVVAVVSSRGGVIISTGRTCTYSKRGK